MPTSNRTPILLGDVLLKQRQLTPHQLGVALDVQRRTKLPIGAILVGANIVSPLRLKLALLWQAILRRVARPAKVKPSQFYGAQLPQLAKARLEHYLKTFPAVPVVSFEVAEQMKLRRERAGLVSGAARIIEKNDVLKERLLTGNF